MKQFVRRVGLRDHERVAVLHDPAFQFGGKLPLIAPAPRRCIASPCGCGMRRRCSLKYPQRLKLQRRAQRRARRCRARYAQRMFADARSSERAAMACGTMSGAFAYVQRYPAPHGATARDCAALPAADRVPIDLRCPERVPAANAGSLQGNHQGIAVLMTAPSLRWPHRARSASSTLRQDSRTRL